MAEMLNEEILAEEELDGWGDFESEDVDETEEELEESQDTTEEEELNEEVEDGEGIEESTDEPEESNEEAKPALVHYKYNGEEGDLTAEEATNWVQKGMNYDKIKEKYDALKDFEGKEDFIDFVEEVAKANRQKPEELIENWRIDYIAKSQHMSKDAARVRYLKDVIAKGKAKPRSMMTPEEVEAEAKAKMNADFQNFAKAYPEVKPNDIPKEVWEDYKENKDLERAWLKHSYKNRNNQSTKEKKNEARSTGSMKSKRSKDPDAWMYEGW